MRFIDPTELRRGFTLIELMVVVAIVGILAAVAVPSFTKYIRKSKTVEAAMSVRKIYDGECAYYMADKSARSGIVVSHQFVSAGPSPSTAPRGFKVAANWETPGWQSLQFGTDSMVLYSYTAVSAGVRNSSSFTARAEGDLDGDGVTSLFERVGSITTGGDISGGGGLYSDREIE